MDVEEALEKRKKLETEVMEIEKKIRGTEGDSKELKKELVEKENKLKEVEEKIDTEYEQGNY